MMFTKHECVPRMPPEIFASRFVEEADLPLEFTNVFYRLNNHDVNSKSHKQYETIILDMRVPTRSGE